MPLIKGNNLFSQKEIFFLKQTNPKAPKFNGLWKLHKEGMPIRPLINFKRAAGYKLAKRIYTFLKSNIVLENDNSLNNNTSLIDKFKNLKIKPSYKLASLDIVNL